MSAAEHPTRRSQAVNSGHYDRVARYSSTFEPLYMIFPPARRRAVAALGLRPGDTVLEIGAGTGRNFPYLVEAVGPTGTVIAVDASAGMLVEAEKLVQREGWSNVEVIAPTPANSSSIARSMPSSSASATPCCPSRALLWRRPGGCCAPAAAPSSWTRD